MPKSWKMNKYLTFSVILRFVTACLLFWAIASHPYDYYILVRWITFGVGLFCIFIAYGVNNNAWIFLFGLLALIFNPIIPLHLSKNVWHIIDIISGILLIVSVLFVREESEKV